MDRACSSPVVDSVNQLHSRFADYFGSRVNSHVQLKDPLGLDAEYTVVRCPTFQWLTADG